MTPAPTLHAALTDSPTLLPLLFDETGHHVHVLALTERDYKQASFLDQRLITDGRRYASVYWNQVAATALTIEPHCDFIFHISHVGSTLLSRLLGEHNSIFSVREPAALRQLSEPRFRDRAPALLALYSRTFNSLQRALIKTTSYVSEHASDFLTCVKDSRAILMYVHPKTFLCSLLGGAMSDVNAHLSRRLERAQSRGLLDEVSIDQLSPGQSVAMTWLIEMVCLTECADRYPKRIQWVDFDQFLANPAVSLLQIQAFLGVELSDLLSPNIMSSYAKQPDIKFDKEFRRQLLAQADQRYAEEIAAGLKWLEKYAHDFRWQ